MEEASLKTYIVVEDVPEFDGGGREVLAAFAKRHDARAELKRIRGINLDSYSKQYVHIEVVEFDLNDLPHGKVCKP